MRAPFAVGTALLVGLTGLTVPAVNAETSEAAIYYQYDLSSFQWWFEAVGAGQAHEAGYTGEGVTVAIIDSGVNGEHPDLTGQVLAGADTSTGEVLLIEEGANSDTIGHGTHVAGIVAAKDDGLGITGIAPQAKIVPVTPLEGYGDVPEIGKAIDWAAEQGVDVINLSLGGETVEVALGTGYDEMCRAIYRATEAGIPVVVSAGNDGVVGNFLSTPAGCPGSISVSSIASDGRASWFTSFDPSVAVSAPGQQVLSTVPTSGDGWFGIADSSGYLPLDGTSMAAPVVSGVVALLKQQNPDITPAEVRQALTDTASDLGRPGPDPLYGAGLVSAPNALGLPSSANSWSPVPHIAALTEDDATGNLVLSWHIPGNDSVNSYVIRDFVTGEIFAEAGPDAVRVAFSPGELPVLNLVVTANLDSGESVSSEPLYVNLAYEDFEDYSPPSAPFSEMTAKWTKKGLKISVERIPGLNPEAIDLEIQPLGDSWQVAETRNVVIPANKSSLLVRFRQDSVYRGVELGVWYRTDMGGFARIVQPQWPLYVKVERLNAYQVRVSGGLNACPTGTQLSETSFCGGRTVSVSDRKGRTLARGIVDAANDDPYSLTGESAVFSVLVTTPPRRIRVTLGSFTSVPVRVPKA